MGDGTGKIGVFLDRDGTVCEEVGYVNHIDRLKLLPRSAESIRELKALGVRVVIVTNQSGVARGYFPESLVREVNEKMNRLLRQDGAEPDAVYYCPHHPEAGRPPLRQNCRCRKPETGMLEAAARDLGVELRCSYVVGDKLSDIKCANRAGAKGILVATGYGRGEWELRGEGAVIAPEARVEDLHEAVRWIKEDIISERGRVP